jgi:chromosomal replication initiation ATPase DnaA
MTNDLKTLSGEPSSSGGGGIDPVSAIANASGDLFNMFSSLFGGRQQTKQAEAVRDTERAKAYAEVESARQDVLFQDSLNTGDLFKGLFQTRSQELAIQQQQAKSNPYLPLFIFGGVALAIAGGVYVYQNNSKNK